MGKLLCSCNNGAESPKPCPYCGSWGEDCWCYGSDWSQSTETCPYCQGDRFDERELRFQGKLPPLEVKKEKKRK